MKRKILNISDSPLIKNYLKNKAEKLDIDFINAKSGFDGLIKMRNMLPDLVIMDFKIPRITLNQFLSDKLALRSTKDIPIILFYSRDDPISKNLILKLAKSKLYKLMIRPIDIEQVIFSINSLFKINIDVDNKECMLEINCNDNILFIEASKGFNKEKIDLMKYKIIELKKQPGVKINKVVTVISDINYQHNTHLMLDKLMYNILTAADTVVNDVTILTTDKLVKDFYFNHINYQQLNVSENYTETMEKIKQEKDNSLNSRINEKNHSAECTVNFMNVKNQIKAQDVMNKNINIAVLNNDVLSNNFVKNLFEPKGWKVDIFKNADTFINSIKNKIPDIIFLDISLVNFNGFALLKYLKEYYSCVPVFVITTHNVKEQVLKAKSFGIKHYFTKPFNTELILEKTEDVLLKLKSDI